MQKTGADKAVNAVKSGANAVKNKANALDDKLSSGKGGLAWRGAKGAVGLGGRVAKGAFKAGGQALLMNAPGAKGFFEGMNAYRQNKENMKTPGQRNKEAKQERANQRHSDLSDKREAMASLVQAIQGPEAAEAFKRDFDDKFKFQPSPEPNVGEMPSSGYNSNAGSTGLDMYKDKHDK